MKLQLGVPAITLAVIALLATVGCTADPGSSPSASVRSTDDASERNLELLAAHADAVEAAIPDQLADRPSEYESIEVSSFINDVRADVAAPEGRYSTLQIDFVYADPVDWEALTLGLDQQRLIMDLDCRRAVFPGMREAGIAGPMMIVYTYADGTTLDEDGEPVPGWQHACWIR